jgi:tRNA-2-methylthio-N6-dimethylallyladenosine synthase
MNYYIWVLGCAMNNSDAERIATVMDLLGYKKVDIEEEANLLIVVACSVRQKAIDRINGRLKVWGKRKKNEPNFKTILTGCVLEKDRKRMSKAFDVIFEINDLGKLPGYLGEILEPGSVDVLGRSGEYLGITPTYDSKFRAYVPIMTGCNNFCSYCAVPYTRGREKSRPKAEVVAEAKDLIKKGFKEITFLGQNVNSYGHDISKNIKSSEPFISLLNELDAIPGDWRGYFYSNHPKDLTEELIVTISKLKHFPPYIHFPLQSGSDRIIKEMNRHYTVSEYLSKVEKIREAMPNVTLTTDVMVGYPGETVKDFEETVSVMKKARFDMAFTALYSPRPGAKSAEMVDDVTIQEKKRRDKILIATVAETVAENNQVFKGRVERVLVDEHKGGNYYGRTAGYKVVEIKTDQPLEIGQFYDVLIETVGSWKLFGKIKDSS